jgi:hypothetical protein
VGKVINRLSRADATADRRPRRKEEKCIEVPEYLDWLYWRLVVFKVATLEELECYYDLADVLEAHEALDFKQELEAKAWEE